MDSLIKELNKYICGNIFKRKKKIIARLNDIQNSFRYGYNRCLDALEYDLQDKLTQTLSRRVSLVSKFQR